MFHMMHLRQHMKLIVIHIRKLTKQLRFLSSKNTLFTKMILTSGYCCSTHLVLHQNGTLDRPNLFQRNHGDCLLDQQHTESSPTRQLQHKPKKSQQPIISVVGVIEQWDYLIHLATITRLSVFMDLDWDKTRITIICLVWLKLDIITIQMVQWHRLLPI